MTAMPRKLRYAMVGGGLGAFIGGVHRQALALDGQYELVAGALSSTPDKALASGRALGLRADRNHPDWRALLADEQRRGPDERIDLLVITAPNHVHYSVALAFVKAGFHVVCDKPLAQTATQAATLVRAVRDRGTVFGVSYCYSGYPLVRQAREMVRAGELGEIRKVVVEYNQGWLATRLEAQGHKQALWRSDPTQGAGAIGDIGSHAWHLVASVTGLTLHSVSADLTAFVPGRTLDDNADVLLRFAGGARGVLVASQVTAGLENALRLRVSGTLGTLEWSQEEPNRLAHFPLEGPQRVLTRGSPWLHEAARRATRLPAGHPEGFLEAFANVYLGVAAAIRAHQQGRAPDPREADYPDIEAGARGVRFIEAVLASSRGSDKWTRVAG